jgi:hypothetical protein
MNEIRQQLNDQARTFATREMFEQLRARMEHLATREMVDDLRERGEKYATKEVVLPAIERVGVIESFVSNMQGRMWAMGALIFFGAIILNLVLRFMFEARVQ